MTDERDQLPTKRKRLQKRKLLFGFLSAWAIFEILVLPIAPRKLALATRKRLPTPMRVIGQSSMHSYPPKDFVLALGDSYAEGWGDWHENLDAQANPPFHAYHLVAQRTGRSILNFGRGGADTVSGTAFLVNARYAQLARTGLGEPKDVVIQFYEGNDLDGSLRDFAKHGTGGGTLGLASRPQELAEYVESRATAGRMEGLPGTLFLPYLFANLRKGSRFGVSGLHPLVPASDDVPSLTHNIIRSGGQQYRQDGYLEACAPCLSEAELEDALGLLKAAYAWVRTRFPQARILVLYVPAPASCYEILSPEIFTREDQRQSEQVLPSAGLHERSDDVRQRVQAIANELGFDFLDTTESIRQAARIAPVHGPRDGHHFNRRGYTIVADVLEPWVRHTSTHR